ncbi:uroporphyrinogen decarboxylase [Hyphomonas sp. CACIAM 19H1]|nr:MULTISPECIES: uroporphyrinogen decarboxylase [Hyphomonas]AXE65947.1 uroporphyrinogen decarboxylase [Hyphomonas sp. CACIAM 19H1]
MATSVKKLLAVLSGETVKVPPVWMMRQAGRHLPEYLETRARAKDFLDFCYTPSLATEATLQPIRRYGMDGAILFADILLILDAMGLKVAFEKGEGPLVEQISGPSDLGMVTPQKAADRLAPVYETVSRVKASLPPSTTLIGFAGSPWTVSLYAVEGRGKTDKSTAWRWAHGRPEDLAAVMDQVTEATAYYLSRQVEAGADALMLFDSWAEGLPDNIFREVVIQPTRKLVARLREIGITVPVIGFPRGAGVMLPEYVRETGVTAVGLDTAASPAFINAELPAGFPVQGHLDPLLLIEGGGRLDARVRQLLDAYRGRPHIFNLGHGIRPETPIAHVERVLELIRTE